MEYTVKATGGISLPSTVARKAPRTLWTNRAGGLCAAARFPLVLV
jgi:hypothetical protein